MTRSKTRRKPRVNRRKHFTARVVSAIKPEAAGVDWFDLDTPGLAIHVSPGGTKTWYHFYMKGRTVRRVKLGAWPGTELAKARKLAHQFRDRIDGGADPAYERRQARDVFTVGMLTKLFIESYARARKATWRDDQWRIDKYVLPAWKSRPVRDITRQDVHAVLDDIAGDGKPIQANRTQALISKLWNFAIDRGHADVNPCHRMAKRAPEKARTTVLDDDALQALWEALDAAPGDAADALRLRLLTGQRGGEVHAMTWAHVDLDAGAWTIPAEQAKNGRAHRVPLATRALNVLDARWDARDAKSDEPRVFPGLYHQRKDLRALSTVRGETYTWHDLRRTVITRLAALGFGEDLIGRVVNHAKRGVTATVYNQYAYDAEKRVALEAWERELTRIVNREEKAPGTVVPMVARA